MRLSLVTLFIFHHAIAAWSAEDSRQDELKKISGTLKYQEGRVELKGGIGTITLSEGFRYVDPAGTETLLTRIWGNPAMDPKPLGMIVPKGFDPLERESWCVIIEFEQDGYVKDDDADTINYTKLLKDMQEGTREANKERVKDGYPTVELIGWAKPPRYDKQTHKFYWAKELKFGDSERENTLNYNLRLLGRRGILVLNAVASMAQFPEIEKATPEILNMVDFNEGHRYADYTPGSDKVAAYGLAALVAGGLAAKTGLLKGLLVALLAMKKVVIIAVIAIGAFIKRLINGRSAPPTA